MVGRVVVVRPGCGRVVCGGRVVVEWVVIVRTGCGRVVGWGTSGGRVVDGWGGCKWWWRRCWRRAGGSDLYNKIHINI